MSLDGCSMLSVKLRGAILVNFVLMSMVNFCLAQQLFYLKLLMHGLDIPWMHEMT
jgi:hypothetical protein